MSDTESSSLLSKYKIEAEIENTGSYSLYGSEYCNQHRFKAYSTADGKEVLLHKINIAEWKEDVVECFMNALGIVKNTTLRDFFYECFASELSYDDDTIKYITESLTENVSAVFAGIGSVRLKLIRKWMQDMLNGLCALHSSSEDHVPIIHGRIRLQYMLYFRSTGQVRMGGYFWLTEEHPDALYKQIVWSKEDDDYAYTAPEVLDEGIWDCGVDVYALGMSFIHLLSGCAPYNYQTDVMNRYSEYSNSDAIVNAIHEGIVPAGLTVMKDIDEDLFDILRQCILPYKERPRAEVLLQHPFFTKESNPDIPLIECKVKQSTYNLPLKPISFTKSFFMVHLSQPRPHISGQRYTQVLSTLLSDTSDRPTPTNSTIPSRVIPSSLPPAAGSLMASTSNSSIATVHINVDSRTPSSSVYQVSSPSVKSMLPTSQFIPLGASTSKINQPVAPDIMKPLRLSKGESQVPGVLDQPSQHSSLTQSSMQAIPSTLKSHLSPSPKPIVLPLPPSLSSRSSNTISKQNSLPAIPLVLTRSPSEHEDGASGKKRISKDIMNGLNALNNTSTNQVSAESEEVEKKDPHPLSKALYTSQTVVLKEINTIGKDVLKNLKAMAPPTVPSSLTPYSNASTSGRYYYADYRYELKLVIPSSYIMEDERSHYPIRVVADIDENDVLFPWKTCNDFIVGVNTIRERNGMEILSEEETLAAESDICKLIVANKEEDRVRQYISNDMSMYDLNDEFFFTLFIPSFYINSDRRSNYALKLRFKMNIKEESCENICDEIVKCINSIRRKNNSKDLSEELEIALVNEVEVVLSRRIQKYVKQDVDQYPISSISCSLVAYKPSPPPVNAQPPMFSKSTSAMLQSSIQTPQIISSKSSMTILQNVSSSSIVKSTPNPVLTSEIGSEETSPPLENSFSFIPYSVEEPIPEGSMLQFSCSMPVVNTLSGVESTFSYMLYYQMGSSVNGVYSLISQIVKKFCDMCRIEREKEVGRIIERVKELVIMKVNSVKTMVNEENVIKARKLKIAIHWSIGPGLELTGHKLTIEKYELNTIVRFADHNCVSTKETFEFTLNVNTVADRLYESITELLPKPYPEWNETMRNTLTELVKKEIGKMIYSCLFKERSNFCFIV